MSGDNLPEDDIGIGTFNAKDVRLGLISYATESLNSIPDTETFGIKGIKEEGLKLAGTARNLNALLPHNLQSPQLSAILKSLELIDGAFETATAGTPGQFDENSFVTRMVLLTAEEMCRLEAAKILDYTSRSIPKGAYEIFLEENNSLIEAVKRAYNLKKGEDSSWDKLIELQRQQAIPEFQKEIS
jgi:hypothetical protein